MRRDRAVGQLRDVPPFDIEYSGPPFSHKPFPTKPGEGELMHALMDENVQAGTAHDGTLEELQHLQRQLTCAGLCSAAAGEPSGRRLPVATLSSSSSSSRRSRRSSWCARPGAAMGGALAVGLGAGLAGVAALAAVAAATLSGRLAPHLARALERAGSALLVGLLPSTVRAEALREARRRVAGAPRLAGRLALVTGGSEGLGRETARALALKGASVVIVSRSQEACEAAAAHINAEAAAAGSGGSCLALPGDVSSLASSAAVCAALLARFPGRALDVLVANAGGAAGSPAQLQLSQCGVERIVATNLCGHFLMLRRLAPMLDKSVGGARVVLVSSCLCLLGLPWGPSELSRAGAEAGDALLLKINDPRHYSATRQYGLAKLGSTALAIELAHKHPGWRVSSAHPGLVESWDRTAALDALRARLPAAWLRGGMDRARAQLLWSPEQGALTQVLLALGAVEHASGAYLHPVAQVVAPPATALDPAFRSALWHMLEAVLSRGGHAPTQDL